MQGQTLHPAMYSLPASEKVVLLDACQRWMHQIDVANKLIDEQNKMENELRSRCNYLQNECDALQHKFGALEKDFNRLSVVIASVNESQKRMLLSRRRVFAVITKPFNRTLGM
jgi:septal ring factor EnvC (AmiA/AmiB activator)